MRLDDSNRIVSANAGHRDLRASLSGKDVPEDIKRKLLGIHEDNVTLKEQNKTIQEKLLKARQVRPWSADVDSLLLIIGQFIKEQDQLFKAEHAKLVGPGQPSVRWLYFYSGRRFVKPTF